MSGIEALVFDVFGTVVDWRSSLIAEGEAVTRRTGVACDWAAFADAWRAMYQPAMEEVRSGRRPFTILDVLHRESLEALLPRFGLERLDEAERVGLNLAWHRLQPWPDSPEGLRRLSARFITATLSNGNTRLLVDLGRRGRLAFTLYFSAQTARGYKPQPHVYRHPCEQLSCPPEKVMMVAAHKDDLAHARACGLRTAFIARPLEFGPGRSPDVSPDPEADLNAADLVDLAARLGA